MTISDRPRLETPGANERELHGSRRVLANAGWRSLAEVGAKVAMVALYVVMARTVGDAQFGVFTLAVAIATLATALGDFGQDIVLTREVAREPSRIHRYFHNTLALRFALSTPVLAAVLGVAALVGLPDGTVAAAVLLGIGVIVDLQTKVVLAAFQAYERLAFVPVVLLVQRWGTALVGLAALALGAGVVVVAGIYAATSIIGFVLGLALLRRNVVAPQGSIDFGAWPALVRAAAPIGLVAAFSVILHRADAAVLAAFDPEAVVGEYGAATRLLEGTLFVSWSVTAAIFPVFARARDSAGDDRHLLVRGMKLAFVMSLPAAVAAAVAADPIIRALYGPSFLPAATALELLAPAIALYPLGFVSSFWLVARDRQRALVLPFAVIALTTVGINFALVPSLSLRGAALAVSFSQLAVVVVTLSLARVSVQGRLNLGRVVTGPILGAGAAAALMAFVPAPAGVALIAGFFGYVVIVAACEAALFPQDARLALALVRRRA